MLDMSRKPWDISEEDYPEDGSMAERARFLLGYAVLAPSSHNSQPWSFSVREEGTVEVHAVDDRWLRVADPDKRELHLSLGCAIENLVVAAEYFGLVTDVDHRTDSEPAARVTLHESGADGDPGLFHAITSRHTNRNPYQEEPLPEGVSEHLHSAASDTGATLELVEDHETLRELGEKQFRADVEQMRDRRYRRELGRWIGSGALGEGWLRARISQLAVTYLDLGEREGRRNLERMIEASAVGILTDAEDERGTRLRAGRGFQRMWLRCVRHGLSVHPISQALEVRETREELRALLDIEEEPLHVFRVGYSDEEGEATPRIPVERIVRG